MKRTLIALLAFSLAPQAAQAATPSGPAAVVRGPASAMIATGGWYDWWQQFVKGLEKSYGGSTGGNGATPSTPNGTGGGATQVPEPAMIVLFGAGAAVIALRRRKRPVSAD